MRVWVSGSRGKLGAEVCRQLVSGGHQVAEADLAIGVDLLDRAAVVDSMRGCQAIIHCAGIASPEDIEPAVLVRTNTITTFNALEEAWNHGIRTAVLASSGSIYGTAWSPDELPWLTVPVNEETPLRYVDPYALTKDLLERTGAMFARRGMSVTALRFHWILRADEVGPLIDAAPPEANVRNLWGYVDLGEAARACLLSLHREGNPFEALLIAAEDTGRSEPTLELMARYSPGTAIRADLPGTTGAFDCGRAAKVIGWTHQSRWRLGSGNA